LTDSRTLDSGLQKEIPAHKNAIRPSGHKSRAYLRLEICTLLILGRLGRILIPDLRLEVREAMAPADFELEEAIRKRKQRFCSD
jgi:hypothetical protein